MTTTFLPTSFSDRAAFDPTDVMDPKDVAQQLEQEQREADAYARQHGQKDFNPDQERDDHGRWTSGGSSGVSLADAINTRTGGGGVYGPAEHKVIVDAIQHASHDAPVLYRGFAMNESNGWSTAERDAFTSQLQPGATIEMKLGSFTEDPQQVGQFAGVDSYLRPTGGVGSTMPPIEGGADASIMADIARSEGFFITPTGTVIQPTDERVVIAVQPGAQALNMQPHAAVDFQDQAEWDTLGSFKVDAVQHDGPVWKVQVTQLDTNEPSGVRGGERQNGLPDA